MNKLKYNMIVIWFFQLLPLIILASLYLIFKWNSTFIFVGISTIIWYFLMIVGIYENNQIIMLPIKYKVINSKYGTFILRASDTDRESGWVYYDIYTNKYLFCLFKINSASIIFDGDQSNLIKHINSILDKKYKSLIVIKKGDIVIKNLKKSVDDWDGITDKALKRENNINKIIN